MSTNTQDAASIEDLLPLLDDGWYASIEGDYSRVKTFGEESSTVRELIASSCADGDIVSWDTMGADPTGHVYLMRRWNRGSRPEHEFQIVTHADLLASRIDEVESL